MNRLAILLVVAALVAQAQKGRPQRVVTFAAGGTANAITGTPAPALAAYTEMSATNPPMAACFTAAAANTGAATLNLNGLGAKPLRKLSGGAIADLVANDLVANQYACVTYLPTPDALVLTTPAATSGAGGGTGDVTASVAFGADNRIVRSDGAGKGVQATGWSIADDNTMSCSGCSISTDDGSTTSTNDMRGGAAPANPPAGLYRIYTDVSGRLRMRDSAGATTVIARVTGTPSAGNCARFSAADAVEDAGAACGGGGGSDMWSPYRIERRAEMVPSGPIAHGANFGDQNLRLEYAGGVGTNVGAAGIAGDALHFGVIQFTTGVTAARGSAIYVDWPGVGTTVPSAVTHTVRSTLRMSAAGDLGANVYVGWVAPAQRASGAPTTGCWIRKLPADTNFTAVCTNGGTPTTVDLGVAPAQNVWYRLEVTSLVPGTIRFRVYDGNTLTTTPLGVEGVITTNVPSGAMTFPWITHTTPDTTSRNLDVDELGWQVNK